MTSKPFNVQSSRACPRRDRGFNVRFPQLGTGKVGHQSGTNAVFERGGRARTI